jgi:hypothetical protein
VPPVAAAVKVIVVPTGRGELRSAIRLVRVSGVVPVPVTALETLPPSELKLTFPTKIPADGGLKRTITTWLAPAPRLKAPPETMLNGAEVDASPVRFPPPVFWMVKALSAELPTLTVPKSCELGVTERMGFDALPKAVSTEPRPPVAVLK